MNKNKIMFLLLFSSFNFAQDPCEKSHSIKVLPFVENNLQKYYVTWSSSSGSDDRWQHDIYNQIVSFAFDGEIQFETQPISYIGTGSDKVKEPVSVAINR